MWVRVSGCLCVYVGVCVCVCVCVGVCVCVCVCVSDACVCECVRVWAYMGMRASVCGWVFVGGRLCLWLRVCARM